MWNWKLLLQFDGEYQFKGSHLEGEWNTVCRISHQTPGAAIGLQKCDTGTKNQSKNKGRTPRQKPHENLQNSQLQIPATISIFVDRIFSTWQISSSLNKLKCATKIKLTKITHERSTLRIWCRYQSKGTASKMNIFVRIKARVSPPIPGKMAKNVTNSEMFKGNYFKVILLEKLL